MSDIDVDDWEQRQVDRDEEDYLQHLMLQSKVSESLDQATSSLFINDDRIAKRSVNSGYSSSINPKVDQLTPWANPPKFLDGAFLNCLEW